MCRTQRSHRGVTGSPEGGLLLVGGWLSPKGLVITGQWEVAGRTGRRRRQHRQGENPATLLEPQVQQGVVGLRLAWWA